MKKLVLTALTVSVLSLNFVTASSRTQLSFVDNLENTNNDALALNGKVAADQACVVSALVVVAVTLMTSAAWTGAGGYAELSDAPVAQDMDFYNLD
jgi:hypothetical protein